MTKTPTTDKPPVISREQAAKQTSMMLGLTVSMAWQLALIVLVPVIGGHYLDNRFRDNQVPLYTVLGLVIALVGMLVIVARTLKELKKYMDTLPVSPAAQRRNDAYDDEEDEY